MTITVASHLPGEGHFESKHFDVRPVCCEDDFDYWRSLESYWSTDHTIINVEHDIDVTEAHIRELLDCAHPLCSWAYHVHWASTGLPQDVIAAGTGARDRATAPDPAFLQGDEEWAAWSAIGLVKIDPRARIASLRREPWSSLELAIHDAVGRPWHMHWPPVTHHHW